MMHMQNIFKRLSIVVLSSQTFSILRFLSILLVLFDKICNLSCLTRTLYLLSNSGLSMMSCHPQSSAIAVSL